MKANIYKKNYQIIVEYDGSKFVGWQMQKNGRSIQGEIQKAIKLVFGKKFKENIIGSGRTDAGVHALGQSANFFIYGGINPGKEKELLIEACKYHSDGLIDADITVQTCWDSDRLDLGRVGIKPSSDRLCTEVARRSDVIEEAYKRSINY